MSINTRREFLLASAATGSGLVVAGLVATAIPAEDKPGNPQKNETKPEEDVSPVEDLMREHGALRRILLIFGEGRRRLRANQDLPANALADSAGIVRSFVEDYHEKLEEDFLFPRFKKAGKLADLVDVLLAQHRAGRRLTDIVLRLSTAQSLASGEDRKTLAESLRSFIRMYGPHAAREDTVLFPALHSIVSAREYDDLGEDFEKKEQQLFGADGFEKMVDRVASIEKSLGIYDLAKFTPRE
jgi:hemerythrin-like domain-containing protein